MKMSPANILRHELIGLHYNILDSEDDSLKGLSGIIVDETRNTLRIDVEGRVKTIPKETVSLNLKLPDEINVVVDGSAFHGRPEERLVRRA